MQDLELGLTFCRTLRTHSESDCQSHRAKADKDHQTALRYVRDLELSDAERKLFEQKERELRGLLGKLQAERRSTEGVREWNS